MKFTLTTLGFMKTLDTVSMNPDFHKPCVKYCPDPKHCNRDQITFKSPLRISCMII